MSSLLMTAHHFTAADCAGILSAFGLFSLVALTPGYAFGWLLDIMRFRGRTVLCQFALSVTLSIALGPIVTYFAARFASLTAAIVLYVSLAALAVVLILTNVRRPFNLPVGTIKVFAAIAVWIVIAVLSLSDLQIGRQLYFSVMAFDYAGRTAFTSSIATYGLPAQNPFFFPGHGVLLHYHYFWPMQAALLEKVGLSGRFALMGATIWSGVGLTCILTLYLRFFSPTGRTGIVRRSLIGIGLLGVTGLDILPTTLLLWLIKTTHHGWIQPSVEWWNEQLDGFLFSMLWEPHAIAALVACLAGFLVLSESPSPGRSQIVACVVAGLAFATTVGTSIYTAFVFAVFLCVWIVISIANGQRREAALCTFSGALALTASLPFLLGLRGAGAAAGPILRFGVRRFSGGEFLLKMVGLRHLWERILGDAVLLPVNYFLELGVFFAAGIFTWRRVRARNTAPTRQELAAFCMLVTSILICTFVGSGMANANNLGWRGFLVAQFVLLIYAVDLLAADQKTVGEKFLLTTLVVLGVSGVVYDLASFRVFPLLSDTGAVPRIPWLGPDGKLGSRTYANREAYEWMRDRTKATAVVQQNPNPAVEDTFYGLYADRQTIAADSACGTGFGGDSTVCRPIHAKLTALFAASEGAEPQAFQGVCDTLPIDVLVAKDTDEAWQNKESWVWTRTPSFANEFVRLFPCGKAY